MAHQLIWSTRASGDLEAIAAFISQDSEVYAASVVRNILQKTRVLRDFPLAGRVVPEFGDRTMREIFAYSYRIIYKVDADEVRIATIVHSKRLLDSSLKP